MTASPGVALRGPDGAVVARLVHVLDLVRPDGSVVRPATGSSPST